MLNINTHGLEIYVIPLVIVLFLYFRNRGRKEAASREELNEVMAAGLTEPSSLHPLIDTTKCLCAGSCVTACPEDAIGIIKGKAVLIQPTLCIGHGACQVACPHQAISLVFGTEKRGMDIPKVSKNFETNVPGIFIAGELGGMGLIRKSAIQGSQAVESITKLKDGHSHPLDVVIVGAGPAGLAGTLSAIENKLRYVTIEQETSLGGAIFQYPRNKVAMTAPLRLPIIGLVKMTEISKEALLEFWHKVIHKTKININYNERMESISKIEKGFLVKTTKGSYQTRAILLSIGRRGTPRKLDVPGENLPKVVYRLIDPEQYRNMHVLVVGGGDSALEAAIAIAEESGTTVTLSYRSEAFGRGKQKNRDRLNALTAKGRIKLMLKSKVRKVEKDTVTLDFGGKEVILQNDGIIVCAGGILPTPFLKEIGVMVETKFGTK
jgi:thioredoxin reductase/ferredoxin